MQDDRTLGEKVSDKIAKFGGSWTFIFYFFSTLCGWMLYNSDHIQSDTFDPYPFILLNLVLSCLAAIQAPIIMMSQNRQAAKDRKDASKDLKLSVDIEKEMKSLHKKINRLLKEKKD